MKKVLGIRKPPINIGDAGVGWVIIPSDLDRNAYVDDCYRTDTVSINGGIGHSVFRNVSVDVDVMKEIVFPADKTTYGSKVVWVKDNVSGYPIIIAIIRNQNQCFEQGENQYHISKKFGGNKVEIFVDGNSSALTIDVIGKEAESSNFNIRLNSSKRNSSFNVYSDNEVVLTATNKVLVNTNNEFKLSFTDKGETKTFISMKRDSGLEYADKFGNKITVVDGKVTIDSKDIILNDGKNGGTVNVSELRKFMQAVLQDLVIAQSGTNVTSWMMKGTIDIEDKHVKH